MAETQVAGEDEVALQGLGGRPSRKESLWKKRHSRNALLVAAVLIVTIIIIIIIIVYKVYQNDIFGYEGFQAVLPQKEICFDPDDPSTYAKYVEVLNKTIERKFYSCFCASKTGFDIGKTYFW
ncbi:uncharacterized protein [Macrobrachium rosenbergii]|uniref:uncharacterized protein n=1 Tax=Macrobrachium rosenbergii TaxID=79674 RepID=UPI0034D5C664